MKIKVNGKEREINGSSISLAELLKREKVENPEMVSVQLNNEFVDKVKLAGVYLKQADEVDFLYFMGGGSLNGSV
ncbi:MAG: sulfur carrier protein ThiS [Candidatus Omnitrophota bacterium]|nr:sulfur carrier protein ThiS [Candidatus Omnitrophota bacterium]